MPYNNSSRSFERVWKFLDEYRVREPATRQAFDTAFDDLKEGIDAALREQSQPSRSDLVALVAAGFTAPNGVTLIANGLAYMAQSGANVLPGLPGWVPSGAAEPGHFGAVGDWSGISGPDDTENLQAWLNYGGELRGDGKKYRITSTLSVAKDSTTIDFRKTLIAHDSDEIEDVIEVISKSNVTIKNGKIDGQKGQKSGAGTAAAYGIRAQNCVNLSILGNEIVDCLEHGIRVGSSSKNLNASDNIITNCGNPDTGRGYAIWLFGGNENVVVSGNIMMDCYSSFGLDDTSDPPTEGVVSRTAAITGNIAVSDFGDHAFRIEGSQDVTFTGNIAMGHQKGLEIRKIQSESVLSRFVASGNLLDATLSAIRISSCQDIIVTANLIRMLDADGDCAVDIYSQTTPRCRNVLVSENLITSVKSGVRIGVNESNVNGPLSKITISGNQIEYTGVPASESAGIDVRDVASAAVKGNEIFGDWKYGVNCQDYDDGRVEVRGNDVTDCDFGFRFSPSGVAVTNLVGNRSHDNEFSFRVEGSANAKETLIAQNNFDEGYSGSIDNVTISDNIGQPGRTNERSATSLGDASDAINTYRKYAGKEVWNSSDNKMMRASSGSPSGAWVSLDGATTITPS